MLYPIWERWRLLDAICADLRLSPMAYRVASRLLFHLNGQDGRCFPSGQKLADEVGVTRQTIVSAVAELRETGWVVTTKTQSSLSYTFAWDKLDPPASRDAPPPDWSAVKSDGQPVVRETIQPVVKPSRHKPKEGNQSNLTLPFGSSASLQNQSPRIEVRKPAEDGPDWDALIFQEDAPALARMAGCSVAQAKKRIGALLKSNGYERKRVHEALLMTIEAVPAGDPFAYALTVANGARREGRAYVV